MDKNKRSNNKSIREISYELIVKIAEQGDFVDRAAADLPGDMDARDRAFIMRLVRGTVERMIELDAVIDHYAKTPVRKQKKQIRNILRMAVYQIAYMDSVPDSAAVNEAVKLARSVKLSQLSGFVNGTLRAICRDVDERSYAVILNEICESAADISSALSIRYSMPREIVEMWLSQYGDEKTEQILAAFLCEHPLTLRVDTNRISISELADRVGEKLSGDHVIDTDANLPVITITPVVNPETLPGYAEGQFYVQNPSAMAPVDHAGIKRGDRILDVCAAPGGKSIQAALLTGEDGRVVACDLNPSRADTIRDNIARMRLSNIDVQVRDASVDVPSDHEAYDVVLADLPCSGLGVLSRKPESKYRYNPAEIADLTALNTRILDTVCSYVRPGGTLVYSTCTINRAENEDMTEAFIVRHKEFTLTGREQILPSTDGADGFYYAVLTKSEN